MIYLHFPFENESDLMRNKVYIETYGCQMNLADTEVVLGILKNSGYEKTDDAENADVIFLNTCSVRDNAEQRIHGRLGNLKALKEKENGPVLGILGCMAERLRKELIEKKKMVDLVIGPDEYRRLPQFIESAFYGEKGIGVKLSRTETYDDIEPYREDGLQAWISVMRGCDKFCTYCVVPYTRGRERSRNFESIVNEVKTLSQRGFREVTLLGQNVNSYKNNNYDFSDLLAACAAVDRDIRIRFTTSHPMDLSDKLLNTISENSNLCNYIHLPVQSGSNRILEAMNRSYTIEHYFTIIEKARSLMPDISFSTDIIAGFPSENEEDHKMTLDIMKKVRYNGAYMFKYSERDGTKAAKLEDDVPEEVKGRRLQEIIDLQQEISVEMNNNMIGAEQEILIEGKSRKSEDFLSGRTDTNKLTIIPASHGIEQGDYVKVKINRATSATLFADVLEITRKRNGNVS